MLFYITNTYVVSSAHLGSLRQVPGSISGASTIFSLSHTIRVFTYTKMLYQQKKELKWYEKPVPVIWHPSFS